ncbi:MAG TPA: hypothetical protein VLM85_02405 [Polyangiaceae bacterium]|nr:hypothetical protein [Polyangiaceae bacterium]
MKARAYGLVAAAWLLFAPLQASAQCGAGLSQCRDCHEVRGEKPVQAGPSAWHRDHAFADFCAACHGGDPQACDEAAAHVGLVAPLADVQATCGPCHGVSAQNFAQVYLAAARPTPREPVAPKAPARGRGVAWANLVLATLVLVLGGGGATYVVRNERRLRSVKSSGDRT